MIPEVGGDGLWNSFKVAMILITIWAVGGFLFFEDLTLTLTLTLNLTLTLTLINVEVWVDDRVWRSSVKQVQYPG